ncbi:hypothetical protein [Kutzneria chonburiensis]|nr:hypothetical protein [Kutzneria chonburiensis]
MKRFVNTYSVLRILRTMESTTVGTDPLALWTIILIRWPLLAGHLERDPELIEVIKADGEIPEPLRSLEPTVRRFLTDAPTELTPALIRSCCGGQVG